MQKPAVHNKQQYTNHITSIKISRFVVGLLQYLCNTHIMQCHIILPTTIPTSWCPCLVFSLNALSTYIIHTFAVTQKDETQAKARVQDLWRKIVSLLLKWLKPHYLTEKQENNVSEPRDFVHLHSNDVIDALMTGF